MAAATSTDVRVSDLGTVVVLDGRTRRGRAWILDNVQMEPWQRLREGVTCEARLAPAIVDGMSAAGLNLEMC